jgi:hypothetical protein
MIPINFDFFNRKVAFLTTSAMDQALFNTLVKQKSIPFLTFDAFISYLNGPHKKKLCLHAFLLVFLFFSNIYIYKYILFYFCCSLLIYRFSL